jgi:hypothetical protein
MKRVKESKLPPALLETLHAPSLAVSDWQRKLLRPFSRAAVIIRGPVKQVEEFLDVESTRLQIGRELDRGVFPGQEQTVAKLEQMPPGSTVSYVVLQSKSREAKCYFEPQGDELLGVMVFPVKGNKKRNSSRNSDKS